MAINQNFPATTPSLFANFAKSKKLDSKFALTRAQTSNNISYMGADGLVKYATSNQPRFDHFMPVISFTGTISGTQITGVTNATSIGLSVGMYVTTTTGGVTIPTDTRIVSIESSGVTLSASITGSGSATFVANSKSTKCLGILLETSSTNFALASNRFDVQWFVTVSGGNGLSFVDGETVNGDLLVDGVLFSGTYVAALSTSTLLAVTGIQGQPYGTLTGATSGATRSATGRTNAGGPGNVSVLSTTETTSPDGTNNAQIVSPTTTGSVLRFIPRSYTTTTQGTYTYSIFFKNKNIANDRVAIYLGNHDSLHNIVCNFTISTKTFGTVSQNGKWTGSVGYQEYPNNWSRLWVTATTFATTITGTATNGSAVITGVSSTTDLQANMLVTTSTAGVTLPAGTKISSIDTGNNTVTLTQNVTVTGGGSSSVTLNIGTHSSLTGSFWIGGYQGTTETAGSVYVWGGQLESIPWASSYIPTTNSTVTRSADNFDITGSYFTNYYNQSQGTIVANFHNLFTNYPLNYYPGFWSMSSGVVGNTMSLYGNGNGSTNRITNNSIQLNGVSQTDYVDFVARSPGTHPGTFGLNKSAWAVRTTNVGGISNGSSILVGNGSTTTEDTTLTLPTLSTIQFCRSVNTYRLAQFAYYPKRLTNTELTTLTNPLT